MSNEDKQLKSDIKKFVDNCIRVGKCVNQTRFNLNPAQVLSIDEILNNYNDTTAKTKIRRLVMSSAVIYKKKS